MMPLEEVLHYLRLATSDARLAIALLNMADGDLLTDEEYARLREAVSELGAAYDGITARAILVSPPPTETALQAFREVVNES
jgi:hypothetical protein